MTACYFVLCTGLRICLQITIQGIRIQTERDCFRVSVNPSPSPMNGTNGTCVDHPFNCGIDHTISFSQLYPTISPMCDYSTTTCQPCPEMPEYSRTPNSPISTTDDHTLSSQYPNEPKPNTSSSQISTVINERDNLRAIVISLGALVGILVVLLIVVTSGWVWTCWITKRNKATTSEHVRYRSKRYFFSTLVPRPLPIFFFLYALH